MNNFKNVIMLTVATLLSIVMYAQQPSSKGKAKTNVMKSAEGEIIAEGNGETDAGAAKKSMKKTPGEPKSMKNKEAEMTSEMEKTEAPIQASVSDNEVTSNELILESPVDAKANITSDNKVVSDKGSNTKEVRKNATPKYGQGIQKRKIVRSKNVVLKSSKKLKFKKGVIKRSKTTSENVKKKGAK